MLEQVTELSSPPSPSQPMIGDAGIHRQIFKIPKDQSKLLDNNDCWAQVLKRRPVPFLNLPPDVTVYLREFHSQQLQITQSDESPPQPDRQTDARNQSPEARSQKSPDTPRSSSKSDNDDAEEDDDEPGQATDWPTSPPEHKYPPKGKIIEDAEDEEQPQFMTQAPISSPRPTVPPVPPVAKLTAPLNFPRSSQEREEPLEIEVPTAIHDVRLPVNKSAIQMNNTPPSAQIVPCTFDQSAPPKKFRKPRIYNPPPEFYRPPKTETVPNQPPPVKITRQADTYANVQIPSSITNISSSIIPSTILAEAPSQESPIRPINVPVSPSKELPSTGDIGDTGDNGDKSHDTQDSPTHQRQSPEYRPQSPQLGSSPPIRHLPRISPPFRTQSSPARTSPPPARAQRVTPSQTPFIRYTITYPNYNGSIGDFITACMYIRLQQRRIRTSLYDDFIRAWYEGYIPYVRECDESDPPELAMNAMDWYNSIDEDPVFSSRIITRQNLESTLKFYPDELRSARSHLGVSPKSTPEASVAPDTKRLIQNGKFSDEKEVHQQDKPDENIANIPEPESSKIGSITVPLPKVSAPPPPPPPQRKTSILPLTKSMSEIQTKPVTTRDFVRSYSEANHQKRKASEDIGGLPTKRSSVNLLPKSDSGSVASFNSEVAKDVPQSSVAPSSTSGRKKVYTSEEKRREAFRKHVKKKKKEQEKRDGIMSSARLNNTPTSAQRQ